MFEAKEIVNQNGNWIGFVFLAIFLLLTIIKIIYHERLSKNAFYFFSKRELLVYYKKEKNKNFSGYQFLFLIIELLCLIVLIYLLKNQFVIFSSYSETEIYFLILTFALFYFLLHYFIGLAISNLFNFNKEFNKIAYFKLNYLNNLILWILPFFLISCYQINNKIELLNLTLFVGLILLLTRYVLVVVNNKKLIFSNLFYFILYICALEIAPLLILLKLII